MNSKTKVFYASQDLIPAVVESLNLQLEQDYKVSIENSINGTEIKIVKSEFMAWAGGKILKTISLSGASNGQIICRVSGMGWGGILLPCIIAIAGTCFGITFPLAIFVIFTLILGIRKKNKLTEEIFQLTGEAIEANKNMAENQKGEKKCPNCGCVSQGSGFCPECGTKIN
ncbi:MAG: hypothetical protein E7045_09645 [Lentisphaerae bacterium]|nr:hypothetical protein [Lentisphaerota bacterium]